MGSQPVEAADADDLYYLVWVPGDDSPFRVLLTDRTTLLRAVERDDARALPIRFDSTDTFEQFREYAAERGIE